MSLSKLRGLNDVTMGINDVRMGDQYDENCTVPAFALNDRGIHGYRNFILLLLLLLLFLLLLLLLLLTAVELSLGGSSPYTSTDKTNKNKYT
jgi:hypothetical protein